MKYKYTLLVFIFTFLFLHIRTATALDIGLGAAIVAGEQPSAGVMVPIRLPQLTLEPELAFYRNNTETDDDVSGTTTEDTYGASQALVGIYLRGAFGQGLEGYYGGRVGFSHYDSENEQASGAKTETTENGLVFIPTFGVQYFLNKQFSMGIDAGWRIEPYTREYKATNAGGTVTADEETTGVWSTIEGRVLVRAMF